jgi:CcmD family protein
MTAINWLMAANAALWIGLGLYVAILAGSQKRLERRVAQWEADHD